MICWGAIQAGGVIFRGGGVGICCIIEADFQVEIRVDNELWLGYFW